jgi:signal transduction histidine kinase
MPSITRSIRFRLSVQYSAVVFGLGSALLGLVYLALRRWLESQTMTQYVLAGRPVFENGVQIGVVPALEAHEMRMIESVYNDIVLDAVARFTILAVVILFAVAIVVGWVMSGRVLRPVEEITQVARDIQASDLSRRIGLEGPDDELTRLASTFDQMLERLDLAFGSQQRFLADTSHDLRTPLTVIRSNVEVVAQDRDAGVEDWREVGGIVQRNVEKMSEMIDGLLATARLQTGKAQAVTLDLSHMVRDKASEFASVGAEKDLVIETLGSPAIVEGVEVAFDRALSNLLDNAIRAAPRGSTIRAGSGTDGDWAWLAVEDRGPGLPEKPDGGRVGLGLSIVEQIASAHGGELIHQPGEAGTGTTMVIWIPIGEPKTSHPVGFLFTNP